MQLHRLFQPGSIGKMELENRLVMAPMMTMSHSAEGLIQDRTVDYYVERAKGGVGLIIVGSSIALQEVWVPGWSGTWDDRFIPGLRKISTAVHEVGGKVAAQISHSGKAYGSRVSRFLRPEEIRVVGPSAITCVRNGIVSQEATLHDIERIVEGFGEAARRVKEAGFDAVEIHGAHGYLISGWLSARDNLRTDEYGGSLEKRARLGCEIVARVREKVGPTFPVLLRISGSHFIEGGVTMEDTVHQAPLFVEAGADALHVSASEEETTQWQFLPYMMPDGAIVHLAAAVKKAVNVPVITVGKIWDPRFAERILEEERADFVAMGRALLADPELPNKAKEGRFDEIRHCIYCNNCLNFGAAPESARARGVSCTVNPALLRERTFTMEPVRLPKKVMVVGGGLAGMEAARVAAERGHRVSLYERGDKLGGQWNIASTLPTKAGYRSLTQYLMQGLEESPASVFLSTEVTRETVEREQPDVVVVATGASPQSLDVPGVDGENVVQANDVIMRKVTVGERVVVIGGRLVGMEVADLLAEQGKKVYLVTKNKLGENGMPLERNIYRALRDRLIEHGVHLFPDSPVYDIRGNGVHIEYRRELVFLKADTVVLAVGAQPENKLAEELKTTGFTVHMIGDCVQARDGRAAVMEGAEIGREI